MTPAECIKNVRLKLGRSQIEFGKLIGKDKTSVCLYEAGKRQPGFPTMRQIVKVAKENGIEIEYSDLREE